MKSPYPGMDPYIEQCGLWEDFHDALIQDIKNTLTVAVPERYLVRTGERVHEEEFRESFVEIREAEGEKRLVTCIEVLSPTNKKPNTQGWDLYQRKRQALFMECSANLVEIDLLRHGQRMPMVDPFPKSPYVLLVARASKMPYCKVWRGDYQKPLPPMPVPLFKPDPDVTLDLQPLVDGIYARARYHRSIDYAKPLAP